jgi:hypothetical protein
MRAFRGVEFLILTLLCLISIMSCGPASYAPAVQFGGSLAAEAMVKSLSKETKSAAKKEEVIERFVSGDRTIEVARGFMEGREVIGLFHLIDSNDEVITVLSGLEEFNRYLALSASDKPQFIQQKFLKMARIRLSSVEPALGGTSTQQ